MGYTTNFEGEFILDRPLELAHEAYLTKFSETRRMCRKVTLEQDPVREAVLLPFGLEGEFCVNDSQVGVADYNSPPSTQPSLWCDWAPNKDGTAISHNESEKFYNYIEWIKYLIKNFLIPWNYVLNGEVEWQGEDGSDFGKIIITDNIVLVKNGKRSFEE